MVGVAFEIHDGAKRKKSISEMQDSASPFHASYPSLFDLFMYAYSYIGLMTGPYYQYHTFVDMVNQDGGKISTVWPAIRNLKPLIIFTIPYFFLSINFPLSFMETSAYFDHPWGVAYQLLYLVPTFTWFRWRFYLGWALAEAMCMTAGLGAYPVECASKPGQGPTQPVQLDFDPQIAAKRNADGDTHE